MHVLRPFFLLIASASALSTALDDGPNMAAVDIRETGDDTNGTGPRAAVVAAPPPPPPPPNNNNNKKVTKAKAKAKTKGKAKAKAKKPGEQKYFHEPGWDAESGHYDVRYFRGKVPYEQHRPVLRHLIRSYLTTFRELGVETWLAHGSLLGWWWNGRIMPWDYDLDVQVSVATLSYLGDRYNRSIHEYEYEHEYDAVDGVVDGDSAKKVRKTYLLDVNPHHVALTKGNGANVIDARWIDTSNGMFIDITGLRERDVEKSPGVWSCKNNHRYRTAELWPLRRTEFEGVEAWIPYEFDKVLTDEYGPKCLVTTEWAG
ncbi:LicD family-domain-containing protein [Xylaria sp. CBS 124048]|nr:LicD family-domain-containing protein [Xylaria sp. CBS 124048]